MSVMDCRHIAEASMWLYSCSW